MNYALRELAFMSECLLTYVRGCASLRVCSRVRLRAYTDVKNYIVITFHGMWRNRLLKKRFLHQAALSVLPNTLAIVRTKSKYLGHCETKTMQGQQLTIYTCVILEPSAVRPTAIKIKNGPSFQCQPSCNTRIKFVGVANLKCSATTKKRKLVVTRQFRFPAQGN